MRLYMLGLTGLLRVVSLPNAALSVSLLRNYGGQHSELRPTPRLPRCRALTSHFSLTQCGRGGRIGLLSGLARQCRQYAPQGQSERT